MPRKKQDAIALQQKKTALEEAIAKLQEQKRANEKAIEADRYKRQLAWEAKVGRMAWLAGFADCDIAMMEEMLQACARSAGKDLDAQGLPIEHGLTVPA